MSTGAIQAIVLVAAFVIAAVSIWPRRPEPTMKDQMLRAMDKHGREWRKTVEQNIAAEQREIEAQDERHYALRGRWEIVA